jgi:hypothetical protein
MQDLPNRMMINPVCFEKHTKLFSLSEGGPFFGVHHIASAPLKAGLKQMFSMAPAEPFKLLPYK